MNKSIDILVEFKFPEDKINIARALLIELALKSLEEEGCIIYNVKQVSRDEQWFIIFEKFKDKEAQDFHKTTSHYTDILKGKLEPLILEKRVRFLI